MREIKFRAWVDEMVEVKMIDWDGGTFLDKPGIMDQRNDTYFFEDYPDMLMQFTGRKDKKGREIYEDDIVACPFSWTGSNRKKYHEPMIYNKPVVFTAADPLCGNQDPRFSSMTWGKWWPDQNYRGIPYLADCWVIGNIHENPELLTLPNNISKQTEEV
jgi:uncharacterized phage protein (TIGR01671 family)